MYQGFIFIRFNIITVGIKNKISMPVKLLISLLTKLNISIYLCIAFLVIDRLCNKLKSFFFQKIFIINGFFKKIVHFSCKRYRSWIFKVCLFLESYAINSFSVLRYAIILTIENLIVNIIVAAFFKCILDNLPCFTFVMIQHSANVLKKKYFWFTFYYNSCKFSE